MVDIQRAYVLGMKQGVVGNADEARHMLVGMADEIGRLREVLRAAKALRKNDDSVGEWVALWNKLHKTIAACEGE